MDSIASTAAMAAETGSHQAPRVTATKDPAKAREVAQKFESFFVAQMVGHMFAGLPTDGPFGGGFGEGVFRSMLIQEYGKLIAGSGGIGVADAVQREILNLQEVQ